MSSNRLVSVYCLEKTRERLGKYRKLTGIVTWRTVDLAINKYLDSIQSDSELLGIPGNKKQPLEETQD